MSMSSFDCPFPQAEGVHRVGVPQDPQSLVEAEVKKLT